MINYKKILLVSCLVTFGATPVLFTNNVQASVSQTSEDPDFKAAADAVDALFTDKTYASVAPTTTENGINAARKLVLKALGKGDTHELTVLVTKAESLLRESTISEDPDFKAAADAVDALFTDKTYASVAPTTTENGINAARKLVLKALGKGDTHELTVLVTKAESLLRESTISEDPDFKAAADAVDALFTDKTYASVAPTTTENGINAARKLVLKALGKGDTHELTVLVTKAESLLRESTISEDPDFKAAADAVDALFTDKTYASVAPTTTENGINAARKLVLKALGKGDTHELTVLVTKAESLFYSQQ